MPADTKPAIDNEGQIRDLVDAMVAAARAKDIDGSVAPYAADVVSYDLVDPLQYDGVDAIRERLKMWFSSFEGPIDLELRDLKVTADDDIAFCYGLHHVNGTRTDGGKLEMWWRTTLCFAKIDGRWTITHSHDSAPFNVKTGMASLDLKP
jgi:uncharacterized protein (TIGR02246 family)